MKERDMKWLLAYVTSQNFLIDTTSHNSMKWPSFTSYLRVELDTL